MVSHSFLLFFFLRPIQAGPGSRGPVKIWSRQDLCAKLFADSGRPEVSRVPSRFMRKIVCRLRQT